MITASFSKSFEFGRRVPKSLGKNNITLFVQDFGGAGLPLRYYLKLPNAESFTTASLTIDSDSRALLVDANTGVLTYGQNILITLADRDPVSGLRSFYLSTDAGTSWSTLTPPTQEDVYAIYTGGHVWLAPTGTGSRNKPLYKTNDFVTWTPITTITDTFDRTNIASIGDTLVHAGVRRIRVSQNAGASWITREPSTSTSRNYVFTDGNAFILVSSDGSAEGIQIQRSVDGINWSTVVANTWIGGSAGLHVCFSETGTMLLMKSNSIYYLRSTDSGATWSSYLSIGGQAGTKCSAYANGKFIVAINTGGVKTSVDGVTWSQNYSPNPIYGQGIGAIAVTPT